MAGAGEIAGVIVVLVLIETDIPVPNLNKCISLMIYYLPTVPADKKEQFDAMSKKDKQNRLYLLLIRNNLTTNDILNWAAMFE